MIFEPTHITKQGFGGILDGGINVKIIHKYSENSIVVQDEKGNIYHGQIQELHKIDINAELLNALVKLNEKIDKYWNAPIKADYLIKEITLAQKEAEVAIYKAKSI
jgi:hypothetical protein